MKILLFIISLIAAGTANAANAGNPLKMLVGTYTNNGSYGVYLYDFDSATAQGTVLDSVRAGNPSFIVPSADRRFAYAVSEFEDGSQGVYSFRLGAGSIESLNFQKGTGGSPCNITVAGGNILTSDYGSGTLSVFPILADGSAGERSFQFNPGEESGKDISRIHCAAVSPDGKYVFITDLGADKIYRATLGGKVPADFCTAYSFDPKVHPGPRHLTFSPDGRFAYLISEKGDCISCFAYSDGTLTHIETQLAYDGQGHGSADIHISPDGRFVYTSHRLKADGIALFERDPLSGKLTRKGYFPTGRHPRNFALTPDGKLLLCACRDDNRIEIYSVDRRTGELTNTGKAVCVPSPVCIQLYEQ